MKATLGGPRVDYMKDRISDPEDKMAENIALERQKKKKKAF